MASFIYTRETPKRVRVTWAGSAWGDRAPSDGIWAGWLDMQRMRKWGAVVTVWRGTVGGQEFRAYSLRDIKAKIDASQAKPAEAFDPHYDEFGATDRKDW